MANADHSRAGTLDIRTHRITKRFGGVSALSDVSVEVRAGCIHALVGENGAGKSTLGKIIAGVHEPDSGGLYLGGVAVRFGSPRDARRYGVARVAQEPTLVPRRSVLENVYLGVEPSSVGFTRQKQLRKHYRHLEKELGYSLDPHDFAGSLRLADQQKVEVMRAVARNARVIVFDEPTASLPADDAERLFATVRQLSSAGTTVVYISHYLEEVLALADSVSVLRDGRLVRTAATGDETPETLIQAMLGRSLEHFFPERAQTFGINPPVLSVENLSLRGAFTDVSFEICAGEIVGLAGLVGSGRSEVAHAIFAAHKHDSGDVVMEGRKTRFRRPSDAMRAGIALVPENRTRQGLLMKRSVTENIALASLDDRSIAGVVNQTQERRLAREMVERLDVRTSELTTHAGALSGGNQQKLLFARWLARSPKVLIVDEPTRGVDVGAKSAIYGLLKELADRGTAVLLISSEIEEIVGLSDRVLVMRDGRLVAEFERSQATEDAVIVAAFAATSAVA